MFCCVVSLSIFTSFDEPCACIRFFFPDPSLLFAFTKGIVVWFFSGLDKRLTIRKFEILQTGNPVNPHGGSSCSFVEFTGQSIFEFH